MEFHCFTYQKVGLCDPMVHELVRLNEMRQQIRPIQKNLISLGLKRYLIIALEFKSFENVTLSLLRRWRGLTDNRVTQVVDLLIELGHLLKLITFQSSNEINSAPLLISDVQNSLNTPVLPTGLVTCSLYKDNDIAIGEVPVTSMLYACGIRKPLIYMCTSSFSTNLVMGILGELPPREIIPLLKENLHNYLALFESGSLDRICVPMSSMIIQEYNNDAVITGGP